MKQALTVPMGLGMVSDTLRRICAITYAVSVSWRFVGDEVSALDAGDVFRDGGCQLIDYPGKILQQLETKRRLVRLDLVVMNHRVGKLL